MEYYNFKSCGICSRCKHHHHNHYPHRHNHHSIYSPVTSVAWFWASLLSGTDYIFDLITRAQSCFVSKKRLYVLCADESTPVCNKITFSYFYRNMCYVDFLFIIIVH
jgi:hypothetical protein